MELSKSRYRPIAKKKIVPSLEECLGQKPKDLLRPGEIRTHSKNIMPSNNQQQTSDPLEGFFLGDNAEVISEGEPEAKKKRIAFTEVKTFKVPIFKIENGIKDKIHPLEMM